MPADRRAALPQTHWGPAAARTRAGMEEAVEGKKGCRIDRSESLSCVPLTSSPHC